MFKIKLTYDEFINKANTVHNNLYDYSLVEYKNSHTKITIICQKHGKFEQLPANHLNNKSGCPSCASDLLNHTKTAFINSCDKHSNGSGILYIIKCFDELESFIKIGITGRTIQKRFSSFSHLPYKYEIVKEISDKAENIWKTEKELHKIYNKYKYKPLKNFGGETECFTLDCLDDLYGNVESILIQP